MDGLTEQQIKSIIETIHKHHHPDNMVVFNGDKQKLFSAIARIEAKMDDIKENKDDIKIIKEKMSSVETTLNAKINTVELGVEKSKNANVMSIFSILTSIGSIIVVIIAILTYKPA